MCDKSIWLVSNQYGFITAFTNKELANESIDQGLLHTDEIVSRPDKAFNIDISSTQTKVIVAPNSPKLGGVRHYLITEISVLDHSIRL